MFRMLCVVMVALALAGAGCASLDRVKAVEQRVAVAEVAIGSKADATAMATEFTAVRGEVKAAVAGETALRETAVAELAQRLTGAASVVEAERQARETAVTALGTRVIAVEDRTAAQAQGLAAEQKDREVALANLRKEASELTAAERQARAEALKAEAAERAKLARKVVTNEQFVTALAAAHRDRTAADIIRAKMDEEGASKAFYLSRFLLNSDDANAALKAASDEVRKQHADLVKAAKDGKVSTVAAYGGQDAVPCRDTKCKDLAARRAKTLLSSLGIKIDGIKIVELEQPKGQLEAGRELRFAVVFYNDSAPGAGGTKPPAPPVASTEKLTFDLGWNVADEAAAKALAAKLAAAGYKAESYQAGSDWYVRHTLAANSDKEATAASVEVDKAAGADSSVNQVTWRVRLQNREFAGADKAKADDLATKLKAAGIDAGVSEGSKGTPAVKVFYVYVREFPVEAEAVAAKAKIDGLNVGPSTIERQ